MRAILRLAGVVLLNLELLRIAAMGSRIGGTPLPLGGSEATQMALVYGTALTIAEVVDLVRALLKRVRRRGAAKPPRRRKLTRSTPKADLNTKELLAAAQRQQE